MLKFLWIAVPFYCSSTIDEMILRTPIDTLFKSNGIKKITHSPNFRQETIYRDLNTVRNVWENVFSQLCLLVKSAKYIPRMHLQQYLIIL